MENKINSTYGKQLSEVSGGVTGIITPKSENKYCNMLS